MFKSQFWRFFLLFNIVAVGWAAFQIRSDISEIFAHRQYAYNPWDAVSVAVDYGIDAGYRVSIDEVLGSSHADFLSRSYRIHGYRACAFSDSEYFSECFTEKYGIGSFGVTYPTRGDLDSSSELFYPVLTSHQNKLSVVDVPVYSSDTRTADVSASIAAIRKSAKLEYSSTVRTEIEKKIPFWILLVFGPALAVVIICFGYKWVRFGAIASSTDQAKS